jgi:hypothetical protein
MNLSEEQLSMVEEMAGLFFSPEIIAINLELDAGDSDDFYYLIDLKDTSKDFVAAYYKGWLESEINLRKAVKQSAMNGSSPSQQMMINYKREGKI